MKLSIIETGFFKLDGGAMFGVVPKSMWARLNPPDEKNLCTWSMRCLLIEDGAQKILIDTGIGQKQDEKFMSHFEPHGDDSLKLSLSNAGLSVEDITDVILTHLHFDHVGGAVQKDAQGRLYPTFPNATYWSNHKHFQWALRPNAREKASFLKENFVPLMEEGVLKFIDNEPGAHLSDNISFSFVNGHTEAMMIPHILLPNGRTLIYAADLMPSSFHVRKPYVMSYDIRPLVTLEERDAFYKSALPENVFVFFEHDPQHAIGKLIQNEKGRFAFDTSMGFEGVVGLSG